MMDGGAAPGGVCGFGTLHQSLDEIDLVELDRERRVFEILGRELKRGLGKIDTVIMVDLGAGEGLLHLAGVAANDVDKGEGFDEPSQRGVEKVAGLLRGQRVIVDELLVGRPLLLELLERCLVGDIFAGCKVVDSDHSLQASWRKLRKETLERVS